MARKNANIVSSNTVLTGFTQKPTISGGQTVLSGLEPIDLNRVDVYKNGILLLSNEDYTVNSITQITMTDALLADDDIIIQSISHGYVNATPLTVDNITVGQYPTVPPGGTQLTLSQAINTDSVLVFKNGVMLKEASDYTVVNNTRIDTIDPLDASDVIHVRSTMDTSTTVTTTITGTSAAAPAPAVNSDPDTGLFHNGTANTLSVAAGGNEVATFADGKVGINTASPSKELHVYRNDTNTAAQVLIEQEGTGDASIGFLKTGVYNWMTGIDTTDNKYKISGSGAGLDTNNYFAIDTTGKVGIGTDAATYALQVHGDDLGSTSGDEADVMRLRSLTTNTDTINFTKIRESDGSDWTSASWRMQHRVDASQMAYLQFNGKDLNRGLSLGTNNTERMRIDTSGNVGIGTTSPETELDVNGTIQDAQGNVRALERNGISTTPYAIPANSSGKYFSTTTGANTITIDAGDCEQGQIITIYNHLSTDVTFSWTNMTSGVFIAGNTTNLSSGGAGSVTIAGRGLVTILNDQAARLILNGNVSP